MSHLDCNKLVITQPITHKKEVSIKYFFSKCDQIRRKLFTLMVNFIFCAVHILADSSVCIAQAAIAHIRKIIENVSSKCLQETKHE